MNKPLLTQTTWLSIGRFVWLKAMLFLLISNFAYAQPCGNPSPLKGVPSVGCTGGRDTFLINPYNAGYTYQLVVSPNTGPTATFFSGVSGSGYDIHWGVTPGDFTFYFSVASGGPACTDTFHVHISGSAAPQMNCNDTVNVSLDENCVGFIYPSLILEGTFDSLDYELVLRDPKTNAILPTSPYVYGSDIGKFYIVSVRHICSGNSCWGYIRVEDKLPPKIVCHTYSVACDQLLDPEHLGFPKPIGAPDPINIGPKKYTTTSSFYDNCGPTTLVYTDRLVHANCPPPVPYIDTVFRDWKATDSYGNTVSCSDSILIRVGSIDSVQCPPNYDNIARPALHCYDTFKLDAAGHPHPDVTGYPTFTKCRNLDYTYSDIKLKVCEGTYKILREWIVADWCTGRQTTCIQIIKVIDDRAPIFACANNITISTLASSCEGEAIIAVPTVFQECSSVTWDVKVKRAADPNTPPSAIDATSYGVTKINQTQYRITNLPVGLSWVLFIGSDACGNVDTCATEVTVEEKTKPIAICDAETVVALTDDGSAKVYAITFDDGSYDNCGLGTFKVRRMDPGNCPNPLIKDDNLFGDYVEFCCNDIPNNPILVVFQVIDRAGNTNECMVRITVQDKKPPVITCLPDITVSCEFDKSNLSVFGTYRRNESERRYINLNDPNNNTFSQPHLWGRDGLVIEDCNLTIDSSVSFNLNSCGLGTIQRRYSFKDDFNPAVTCTQTITVVDYTPFNGVITWPANVEINGCHSAIDPNLTGKPSWPTNLSCSNILATYEDQVFNIVENVCFKVLRKWTVVDWCIYNSQTGYGRWTYTQIIKIRNTVAPTFTSPCTDLVFDGISSDCNGFATLTVTATDDCQPASVIYSYTIDLNNDNTIDLTGTGNNASGVYPNGTHRIKWTVYDQCGNSSTCTYLFTIVDRKQPTPFCRTGIITVIMPSTGQVTIWASDLNSHSLDNCTPAERLRYSFSSNPSDASRTYTCAQIINGISQSFDVRIYVTDESGNQDYCDTKVIIQDGIGNACPDNLGGGTTGNLAGSIFNEANNKVENAMVTLNANMPSMPKYEMTRPDGQYTFVQLPLNEDYIISAQKDDDPLNGVTTQDIVLIQKHILGLQLLNSPYKIIAADVNNSQSITAKDVSDIRRLILGVTTGFTNNKPWKFINANVKFQDVNHPWPYMESNTISKLNNDLLDNNFIAVKMGDVSGNAKTNSLQATTGRSNVTTEISLQNSSFEPNEVIKIPVKLSYEKMIYGMQAEFTYDPSVLNFIELLSGNVTINESNYTVEATVNGKIKISWDQLNGISCNDPLFYLVFKSNLKGTLNNVFALSNDNFLSEVYDENAKNIDLRVKFYKGNGEASAAFYLFQNQPNPFSSTTTISFQLPKDGFVDLKISDVNGKVVLTNKQYFKAGFNSVEINKSELNRTGVLYYHLEMDGYRAVRKMLIID
jgi:hypothetical protein